MQVTTRAIKLLVRGFVELDGTVRAVKCTVFLMTMIHTDTTHVSLVQGERCVCKDGMCLVVKYTVCLGMTPWRGTYAIPWDKRSVCRTGTVHTSAIFTVNKQMIPVQVTVVTQMETKFVCKAGMVCRVIAHQRMTRPRVTRVIALLGKESAWRDGLEVNVMFSVHQGTILRDTISVTMALEPKSVYRTGLAKTVPCTARPEMIPWVNTSAR